MPLKYQTDQYPTHSTSTTQQIRPNSYVTWQLLYPNWLDLILSNTVLPCLILLHQPLSLLSRTLSLYICIITLPLNSNFIQLCLHPNVYHTLLCLSLLHTRNLTFPFTTLFFWPTPSSALSKQIPTLLNRHTCTYPTFRNAILIITPTSSFRPEDHTDWEIAPPSYDLHSWGSLDLNEHLRILYPHEPP